MYKHTAWNMASQNTSSLWASMNCETILLTNQKAEWPLAGPIKMFLSYE